MKVLIKFLAINAYSFGLLLVVNTLEPFILSEQVNQLAPPNIRNTVLGVTALLGLLTAGVSQILVGYINDKQFSGRNTKQGFLFGGIVVVACSLNFVIQGDTILALINSVVFLQIGMSMIRGTAQPFLPAMVPIGQRGLVSAVKSFLDVFATIVAVLFLSRGVESNQAEVIKWILILTVIVSTSFTAKQILYIPANLDSRISLPFRFAIPKFANWAINRILFWMGATSIRTFIIYFLEDALGLANPTIVASNLLALLILLIVIISLPSGWVSDRYGHSRMLLMAGSLAGTGTVVIAITSSIVQIFLGGLFLGIGMSVFLVSSWAQLNDIVPKDRPGYVLAIGNIATVIGSMFGRLWGPGIDLLNHYVGNPLGYRWAFGISAVCFFMSTLIVLKMPEKKSPINFK